MPKQCHVASVISNQHSRMKNVEKKSFTQAIYENITKYQKNEISHIFKQNCTEYLKIR